MIRTYHGWWAVGLMAMLGGCRGAAPAPYVDFGQRAQLIAGPTTPTPNPFSVLVAAAQSAEKKSPNASKNTTFAPLTQKDLKEVLSSEVSEVRIASRKPLEFTFAPSKPFVPAPNQRGWRLLGRVMVWTEQSACGLKDYDKAIWYAVDATNFGYSLTNGGATDAALGLTIADEARRAIAPSLSNMTPAQLDKLAAGLEQALLKKPTLSATFKHEHQNMLLAVQYVQDCYAHEDFKNLRDNLGPDIREAVDYLRGMREDERPGYFTAMATEADNEAMYLDKACLLPARKREEPEPDKSRRPWKRFSKIFFGTGRPLLTMNDSTLARSRMLVATCRLLALIKQDQPIPKQLTAVVSKNLSQDPFSGNPFLYKALGDQFKLYSVGRDFQDDGGETDPETFQSPDMTLERTTD